MLTPFSSSHQGKDWQLLQTPEDCVLAEGITIRPWEAMKPCQARCREGGRPIPSPVLRLSCVGRR